MYTDDVNNETPATHVDLPIEVSSQRVEHWEDLTLHEVGVERLRLTGTHDEHTLDHLEALWGDLSARLRTSGPAESLVEFVREAKDHDDALDRLATIHTIEQLEGRRRRNGQRFTLRPVPWPGWINPRDPHRRKRVLRDLEIGLVRLVALDRSRMHVAVIGVGESGGAAGELPHITTRSIDGRSNIVLLPGGVDGLEPRTCALPAWTHETFQGLMADVAGVELKILYTGTSDDDRKIQSCISMNAGNILRTAGIGDDPSVSFASLRHTTARSILDSAGTDAAVAFLGESDYTAVRTKLGLRRAEPIQPRKR